MLLIAKTFATDAMPVTIRNGGRVRVSGPAHRAASVVLAMPGKSTVDFITENNNWFGAASINVDIVLPEDAPDDVMAIAHVVDRDLLWFQNEKQGKLRPGGTNRVQFSLSPEAIGWQPHGHHAVWNGRTLLDPGNVALDLYSDTSYTGRCTVVINHAHRHKPTGPPTISAVRPPRASPHPALSIYEIRMQLPERYADPFDEDAIHLYAEFRRKGDPSPTVVDGFFYQSHFLESQEVLPQIVPQGKPEWRVRFCPQKAGEYECRLHAKDPLGEFAYPALQFSVTNTAAKGFIRVSQKDPRYFETLDGSFFFPIGHNIRSPYDNRMMQQFPWREHKRQGSTAYERYFKDMHAHGEDFAEIWSCAWSLGLEWTATEPGYHGTGDYNMIHAWELDTVLAKANKYGIFINLVLNNHGRLSSWIDPEWEDHPYNVENGGYLRKPKDFFDSPRAIRDTEKLYRYMVARYAAYRNLFAWELWSELDLVGSSPRKPRLYRSATVVNWHDHFGKFLKRIDPYKHLVATHYSGNFRVQNPGIVALDAMDHAPVDAYHFKTDPLQIMRLMVQTSDFNKRFDKPSIVTEFGGSHMAASSHYLAQELHCAIWGSTCSGLAGVPLFWWWQLIEEENYYSKYAALRKFVKGLDLRDPALTRQRLIINAKGTNPPYRLSGYAQASRTQALGWIFATTPFKQIDKESGEIARDQVVLLKNIEQQIYLVRFYDTTSGDVVMSYESRPEKNQMTLLIPAFRRDIAFRVEPLTK